MTKKYVMKKNILILFILLTITSVFIIIKSKEFVSIKENKFILNGREFYPITLNYIVALQTNGKDLWVSSGKEYASDKNRGFNGREKSLLTFKSDMELIKSMGFNSVRIVRIGEIFIDEDNMDELSFNAAITKDKDTSFVLSNNEHNYNLYFDAIEEMLSIIKESGLKVIFLMRMKPHSSSTLNHLTLLSSRFEDNETILAYDFFNEPLYFDFKKRTKESVAYEVNLWDSVFNAHDKNHLTTIGLEGIREVFKWDPNILNVDFISYHPYEHEPEQVRNEMFWYGKYTKKPWIIGETAIPADNDSITYEEQFLFAEKTLKQTRNCGGSGYSWWQFKDVDWVTYYASFLGVVTKENKVKTVANAFKNYNSNNFKKDSCLCLNNYYNYTNNNSFRLIGVLLDSNQTPIEGGVILAWNEFWSHSYHTITKKDGSFELLSDYPFYHWMASATEYSTVRGEIDPNTAAPINGIPTINLKDLKIGYLPFLIKKKPKK
jgi:hypothetical protein